jgi:hypothetical protein
MSAEQIMGMKINKDKLSTLRTLNFKKLLNSIEKCQIENRWNCSKICAKN